MTMYIDLWKWFAEYEQHALHISDPRPLRLITLSRQGWRYIRASQPDMAFASFQEGRKIAHDLQEPCWELFFEYWSCEIYLYHKDDHPTALDMTVKLASRAHAPQYQHCPVRSRIYFILADVYFETDSYSYETQIQEALNTIERDIPMDEDTHLRVLHLRAEFDFEFERYDQAEEKVRAYLGQISDNAYRLRSANNLLRRIAYQRGDIDLALYYCLEVEKYAKITESNSGIAIARLWQSVYLYRLAETSLAHQRYQTGLSLYQQGNLPRWLSYYDVICTYLELTGDFQGALNLREQCLADNLDKRSVYYATYSHLQYCRTLGRLGKPLEQALESARQFATKIQKPDVYLARLQKIADGHYWEYEWQKP